MINKTWEEYSRILCFAFALFICIQKGACKQSFTSYQPPLKVNEKQISAKFRHLFARTIRPHTGTHKCCISQNGLQQ
jgi:hypothetical protein